MMRQGVVRVAGHQQHLGVGKLALDLVAQILAAHLRHDDVGQHQIKRRILPDQFQGLKGIAGFLNLVAAPAQDEDGQLPHGRIVLHHQEWIPLPSGRVSISVMASRFGRGVGARQIDFEGRAGIGFAINADIPAALANDAIAGGQTQDRCLCPLLWW